MSRVKRKLRQAAVAAATAVAVAATLPAGAAHAIDAVECGRSDFLHVWGHSDVTGNVEWCFANKGPAYLAGLWVDKISTGNNLVRYYDWNGDVIDLPKNHIRSFPNRPPKVRYIEIL